MKGSVTVSGSNSTIDETTFKSSDINIIVIVKVTNQTTLIKSNAKFMPMKGVEPGSQRFNESYGDSYISGFIQGGEFTGIISIKVIDRTNVDLIVNKIKANLDAKDNTKATTEFTLSPYDTLTSTGSASITKNTESHIYVSWMGGGQIKDGLFIFNQFFSKVPPLSLSLENTPWNIDSIFQAAAAFPQRVSESPQRTWAILTKYKSNRSFIEWSSHTLFNPLEYDQISGYTAELFDSYMDYKVLLKYVQQIIDNPENYRAAADPDALDTSLDTLLGVRFVLRREQTKIIEAISVLSRDPGILTRQSGWDNNRCTKVLSKILKRATGSLQGKVETPVQPMFTQAPSSSIQQNSSSTQTFENGGSVTPLVIPHALNPAQAPPAPSLDFDFSSLIPADIWRTWMPVLKPISQPPADVLSVGILPQFPSGGAMATQPPPSDDSTWGKSKQDSTETAGSSRVTPQYRMDNCLPYQYNGATVMFKQLYNNMALDASKADGERAQAFKFNMEDKSQIFLLRKTNDDPATPWTIARQDTNENLYFLNGEEDYDVRVGPSNGIPGLQGHWYIGRGSSDRVATWVLKNAQFGTCIELETGWSENGLYDFTF
ncbi:hypothetical protein FLONG3_6599 [Fusarium longipes]|uniref:Uncharacterized protein n=1 Tax=Fusarium longipes TaxID=694270 RepID=A0A395SJM7_9HYPO|nr:hypothetical protein FLONG3_6599 [Fusarium longipes]